MANTASITTPAPWTERGAAEVGTALAAASLSRISSHVSVDDRSEVRLAAASHSLQGPHRQGGGVRPMLSTPNLDQR